MTSGTVLWSHGSQFTNAELSARRFNYRIAYMGDDIGICNRYGIF